jgi:ComF family protein
LRGGQLAFVVAPVQTMLRAVFSVLFPSDCRLCDTPLTDISRVPVCPECVSAIEPVREPQCELCGDRLASAQLLRGDGCCQNCHAFPPHFDRATSFGEYEAELRELIHLLKYDAVTPVAPTLGKMLASSVEELLPECRDEVPLLVPVPLHKGKRHERGFNQSEVIARAALRHLPKEVGFGAGVLVRQRATLSQVGLPREQRMENMRDAFRVAERRAVRDRVVIVVDDVMTTGATLSECALVLKKAGARKVLAATVARTFQNVAMRQSFNSGDQEEVGAALAASV